MNAGIYFFSQDGGISPPIKPTLLGLQGSEANELAELGLPILPGCILDAAILAKWGNPQGGREREVLSLLDRCGGMVGRRFADPDNPLLIKALLSPNLAVSAYPVLHNLGLVKSTLPGFIRRAGRDFAAQETLRLIRDMLCIEERLREREGKETERAEIQSWIGEIDAGRPSREAADPMDRYAGYFPGGFFDSAGDQLRIALGELVRLLALEEDPGDTALVIQAMAQGGRGKDSCSGSFFSRDIMTGENQIRGTFSPEPCGCPGTRDIRELGPRYLKELRRIARVLEDRFKDIRRIGFILEEGKLWILDQRPAEEPSARAEIKLLLDLVKRNLVDKAYAVKALDPRRLHELLHPRINASGAAQLKKRSGGMTGAPGAAVGRVCFSAKALLEAHSHALRNGEDTRFILVLASSFAGDVQAIETAAGVLTAEGGYSAHASVVARQYGTVSLVDPALRIRGKTASLGDLSFREGDPITINAPYAGEPAVFLGAAKLIEPDLAESGLLELIALAKGFLKRFQVRANAETPREARLALAFGAEGIGLCRTEHMFFDPRRINVFREMLLSESRQDRDKALAKLRVMQRDDFYRLLKIMAGKGVCIRLLDAPLHEFMPHTEDELAGYIDYLAGTRKTRISKSAVLAGIGAMKECNPMLGRRGCRIAVSYPEIYAMQVRAIFEAAYKLRDEQADIRLEILVPLVMNASELKLIAYGKHIEGSSYAGITDIEEALRKERPGTPVAYRIGAMIELPAAALGAGEIARYGQFFSFGANDLTQTTLGISRDDFTGFMPDYSLFDLLEGNPFKSLDPRVKELIALAVERGRLTRPDLVCGLCGEQGADPDNIRFCIETGLDYVSCSPYSTPIAILAASQAALDLSTSPAPG